MPFALIQMLNYSLPGRAHSFKFLLLCNLLLSSYYTWSLVVGNKDTVLNKNVYL